MQSAVDPEGTHILGGLSDGYAYSWQVFVAFLLPFFSYLHFHTLISCYTFSLTYYVDHLKVAL
jgi:hypothetical protein